MHQNTDIQNELATISSFWQSTNATMPYQVPAQYFEELYGTVRASIEKEAVYAELESVAPLLNTIPKTNVYQQPVAVQKRPVYQFVKWAVAALFIGVMAISTFLYNSKVEKFDYSAYSTMDHNQLMQSMSDSTLLSYMNVHENLISTPDVSVPDYEFETEVALIEQSTDEELSDYVESSN